MIPFLSFCGPYLDPGQCGGLRRSSINHYLIKLLDFIHTTIDSRIPHAVVLAALDLSKAYNRGDSYVIEDLHDMHTPGWLLALLCSYLSSRSLVLSYQKKTSVSQDLPGGYGAGTWMGGFLFIIKFNGICLCPSIPRPNGNRAIQLKFVDDSTKAASINLKNSLVPDPNWKPFPINYHEGTGMIINPQDNILEIQLDHFHKEATENNFITNKKKTTIMVFNATRIHAFSPEFRLGTSEILQTKSTHKILGLQVQSDLKWGAQIEQMTKKASKKIWLLRRMKQLGVDDKTVINYWKSEGLCHLEFCAPVWAGGITQAQARDLTRVQRRAVAAITGSWQEDYKTACLRLGIEADLNARRLTLCKTFALKTATKSRHQDLFTRLDNPNQTRSGGKTWREPPCRTRRHLHMARPHLSRLLNGESS